MKKIVTFMIPLLILAFVGYRYYRHFEEQFSVENIEGFLRTQIIDSYAGRDETACNAFSDDVEVTIAVHSPQGDETIKGGKEDICLFMRRAAAPFSASGAQAATALEGLEVNPSSFPWLTAEVRYLLRTSVTAPGNPVPLMTRVHESRATLRRGLSDIHISKLDAKVSIHLSE